MARPRYAQRRDAKCSVHDCGQTQQTCGLCGKHYRRLQRHGDTSTNLYSLETRIAAFWSKVIKKSEEECWPWSGNVDRDGYGFTTFNLKAHHASRLAYWFTKGTEPRLSVLHTCDNAICCNPNHLYEGTQAQNIADKMRRNRQAKGEQNGGSKYKDGQIVEVCHLIKAGIKSSVIARMTNVQVDTVKLVRKGVRWRHISRGILHGEA